MSKKCQCAACGEWFVSEGYFNRHRVGGFQPMLRRCLTAEEMVREKGMGQRADGRWGGPPMTLEQRQKLYGRTQERVSGG